MVDSYDQDWYKEYEAARAKRHREHVLKTAFFGYLFGQMIGTSAYVLNTGRPSPAALGAGAFMGVCLSVGYTLRSL